MRIAGKEIKDFNFIKSKQILSYGVFVIYPKDSIRFFILEKLILHCWM